MRAWWKENCVAVILAGMLAVLAVSVVIGNGLDNSEEYCTQYQNMTGAKTRWAANTCWVSISGERDGPYYPLEDVKNAR